MMIPLALLLVASQGKAPGFDLPPRYWLDPVKDTYIDSARADENFGREPSLVLGPGRAVLIDFPSLRWMGYGGKRVQSAELVLTFSRPTASLGLSVSMIKTPWGEGGGRSLRFDKADPGAQPWGGATWKKAISGKEGTSWQSDGASGAGDATRLDGIDAVAEGRTLRITGLGSAIQAIVDRPDQNYGLRIESNADVAFFSGEFTDERPKLDVAWSDSSTEGPDLAAVQLVPGGPLKNGAVGDFNLLVKNVGATPVASARVEWMDASGQRTSVPLPGPVAPGSTAQIKLTGLYREDPAEPRKFNVSALVILDGDTNPGNNFVQYYGGGVTVDFQASPVELQRLAEISPNGDPSLLFRQVVNKFNVYVLPFSRFIHSPEGIRERLNLSNGASSADIRVNLVGLEELSESAIESALAKALSPVDPAMATPPASDVPWDRSVHALGWFPDTRDDGLRIPGLELPAFGFAGENEAIPLFENGLLSRQEAFAINRNIGKRGSDRKFPWDIIQQGLLIKAVGLTGNLLDKTAIGIFKPGFSQPLVVGDTGGTGLVYFGPNQLKEQLFADLAKNPQNGWLRVEATNGFDSASVWLPASAALDWFVRGNSGLTSVELRFPIANRGADRTQDLAAGKVVADSSGRYPAELAALVDGEPSTTVDLFPGQWIEIDLARDRTVGQIDIGVASGVLEQFDILFYGTSQTAESAARWASVSDGKTIQNVYGGGKMLPITAPARSARYVRLVNRGSAKVTLAGITVFPAKSN